MTPESPQADPPVPQTPPAQYVSAEYVLDTMGRAGVRRIRSLSAIQIIVLGAIGGGFITVGALFSLLLGAGVGSPGPQRLLEGLGFSAGFFFVILSEAALFTEANVALPATLLRHDVDAPGRRVARFWALAWVGNLAGAVITGLAIHAAQRYSADVNGLLRELVARKMSYRAQGGAEGWLKLILSGMLANWLVGMERPGAAAVPWGRRRRRDGERRGPRRVRARRGRRAAADGRRRVRQHADLPRNRARRRRDLRVADGLRLCPARAAAKRAGDAPARHEPPHPAAPAPGDRALPRPREARGAPVSLPQEVQPIDFGHARQLIERALSDSRAFLDWLEHRAPADAASAPAERLLSHTHA
jgi:hypothetical protein